MSQQQEHESWDQLVQEVYSLPETERPRLIAELRDRISVPVAEALARDVGLFSQNQHAVFLPSVENSDDNYRTVDALKHYYADKYGVDVTLFAECESVDSVRRAADEYQAQRRQEELELARKLEQAERQQKAAELAEQKRQEELEKIRHMTHSDWWDYMADPMREIAEMQEPGVFVEPPRTQHWAYPTAGLVVVVLVIILIVMNWSY